MSRFGFNLPTSQLLDLLTRQSIDQVTNSLTYYCCPLKV